MLTAGVESKNTVCKVDKMCAAMAACLTLQFTAAEHNWDNNPPGHFLEQYPPLKLNWNESLDIPMIF